MKTKFLIFLGCLITFGSCYNDLNEEGKISDEFYLRHQGADMPVWVKGNAKSETFIIFVHGGPFQTSIEESVYGNFDPLEEEFAMVYYDQRGGGFTHGQITVNLTEDQLVEDLEVLTDLLKEKYPQAKSLFLMGHSWGGYLSTAFLKNQDNQLDYRGYINIAGTHNYPLTWITSREFCIDYINNVIGRDGEIPQVWKDRLKQLEDTPAVNTYGELTNINSVAQQIQSELNVQSAAINPSTIYFMSSPVGATYQQKNNALFEEVLVNGNHTPDLQNITLPSLVLFGRKDAIVTIEVGQDFYDNIKTAPEDKYFELFEDSSHIIFRDEINKFFSTVGDFIERYN